VLIKIERAADVRGKPLPWADQAKNGRPRYEPYRRGEYGGSYYERW